jgi:hypothetical protein
MQYLKVRKDKQAGALLSSEVSKPSKNLYYSPFFRVLEKVKFQLLVVAFLVLFSQHSKMSYHSFSFY